MEKEKEKQTMKLKSFWTERKKTTKKAQNIANGVEFFFVCSFFGGDFS